MPDDKANYLHRIGRVGRAKRMGLAIRYVNYTQLLVLSLHLVWLENSLKKYGIIATVEIEEKDVIIQMISRKVVARFGIMNLSF